MKKKVLHVVGAMNMGGTETMLMNLYRRLYKDIQFDFVSYSNNEGYYDNEIKELGGRVIRLELPQKTGGIKTIKNLISVIKKFGPYEAIHAHTLFNCGIAVIAGYICGIKVRISHAHTTAQNSSNIIKKVYICLMQIIIKVFSTDYLACSIKSGRYLFGKRIIKNNKLKIIPNYVEYSEIINYNNTDKIRMELGIREGEILIGHIGRFVIPKNHKFLVNLLPYILKINDKVRLILVGDGYLRSEVEGMCKELGITDKVYFLGVRSDIKVIINNLDLFIFPSIYEGLGLVLLEAQAGGIPCLVSEAIQPEADLGIGLVKQIKLDDGIDKWADEALKLIGKKNNNKEAIEEAFKAKGYEIEDIVNTLLDVYKININ